MVGYNGGYPQVMTASGPAMPSTYGGTITNDINDLAELAQHILDKVVETYQINNVSLPDRQYIALSTPAQDCEQLTVAWQQMYLGAPGDEQSAPQRCESPRSAVFEVVVTRCVPVVDDRNRAPEPTALSASAAVLMRDACLLMDSIKGMDDFLGVTASVAGSEAQGGLQSVTLTLAIGVV